MKTLLTEKQIYKIHKGDNHSGRTRVRIGDKKRIGRFFKKTYKLVDKIVFKIDTCPHCGNHNTFHKRSQDVYGIDTDRNYGNVYKSGRMLEDGELRLYKIDYCLDCHKEFSIEMFIWKKVK